MSSGRGPRHRGIAFVLGSHRAGTSAVARTLQLLGLELGPADKLLGPIARDNEKGFFEHLALMEINNALLDRFRGTWRNPPRLEGGWQRDPALDDLRARAEEVIRCDFGDALLWGFKDPRTSLTWAFWEELVAPSACIVCCRNPLDVARSLRSRNRMTLAHGVALWLHYTASAIANTAGSPRLIVSYDGLFERRASVVRELAETIGRPTRTSAEDVRAAVDSWIDPAMRHHTSSARELERHPAVSPAALALWRRIDAATRAGASGPSQGAEGTAALDAHAKQIATQDPPREQRARPTRRRAHRPLRIVALLQVYNEQRFIAGCIEHLREQGVAVYLIDNESTDATLEIAQQYLGDGIIDIETLPRDGVFALRRQCARQEELAQTIDADWFIHCDADEIRVSPNRRKTLADAIAEFDAAGFNAVNFLEFAFVPTRESPDHDHPRFRQTMRWYYPFLPRFPHRVNAWKRQEERVDLATDAGHAVAFPGLRMAPTSLYMRHYLFVSVQHAIEKFVERRFAPDEVADGWFGWRSRLRRDMIQLPSALELRYFVTDHLLDPSAPWKRHALDDAERPGAMARFANVGGP